MIIRAILLFSCLLSVNSIAQVGHPAKGSWSGYFDFDTEDTSRLRLLINAHNGTLTGIINPGRNSQKTANIELDAPNWTLTIEAEMPDSKLIMVGKLENLGSWTNRKYYGTYIRGDKQGTFSLTLN